MLSVVRRWTAVAGCSTRPGSSCRATQPPSSPRQVRPPPVRLDMIGADRFTRPSGDIGRILGQFRFVVIKIHRDEIFD